MKAEQALVPKLRFEGFRSPTPSFLGEVTKWSSGGTPPKDNPKYWGNDIPWISAASMRGSHYSESKVWLTVNGLKNGSKLIKKGGILLLVRGSMLWNCIPVGVAARDLAFNQDVKGIEPSPEVGNVYLLHWFSSMEHRLLNMVVGTGIGAGKLDTQDLKSLPITLPSLPEQEKIAAFLTSVDDRIDQLKRKKSLLQDYKKGAMQKIFSQELRFKDEQGNPYPDWEEKKLGEVCEFSRGKNIPAAKNAKYTLLGMGSVGVEGRLISSKTTAENKGALKKNDLIMPERDIGVGLIIGRVALVKEDNQYILGSNLLSLRPNKDFNSAFLHQYINSEAVRPKLRRLVNGSAQLMITSKEVKGVKSLFPVLPEQTKIANFLSSLDQKIEQIDTQITQTQTFKKGLLQQMFV